MTWQPIETAPRDGTWVLLYSPNENQPAVAYFNGHAWDDNGDGGFWFEPTHWMPLPPKPGQEEA